MALVERGVLSVSALGTCSILWRQGLPANPSNRSRRRPTCNESRNCSAWLKRLRDSPRAVIPELPVSRIGGHIANGITREIACIRERITTHIELLAAGGEHALPAYAPISCTLRNQGVAWTDDASGVKADEPPPNPVDPEGSQGTVPLPTAHRACRKRHPEFGSGQSQLSSNLQPVIPVSSVVFRSAD